MCSIVDTLGPFPQHWKDSWNGGGESVTAWYDPSTKPQARLEAKAPVAKRRPEISPERDLFASVVSKVFLYKPESRLTATELLEDSEFQAPMAYYGL